MKRRLLALLLTFALGASGVSAAAAEDSAAPSAVEVASAMLPVEAAPAPTIERSEAVLDLSEGEVQEAAIREFLEEEEFDLPLPITISEEEALFFSSLLDAEACLKDAAAAAPDGVAEPDRFFGIMAMGDPGLMNADKADEAEAIERLPEVPIVVNKRVEVFINYFQNRGRKYFEKWSMRSQNYMTMLRSILKENGLPEDLSYIAFIESGINPTAKSRANAVGMWQFIKGTATRYGLRVDSWVDERMDPEKATYAAAKYFKNLYSQFGHWYLAAAGYNAGEGKIVRAVKNHKTDDFWKLAEKRRPLKRETKEYVPKYLAAMLISKDPTNYGFEEVEYSENLPYEKVKVEQATDLRVIAEAAGTSLEEIRELNPELIRMFTPPNYPGYQVKVPVGSSERFYGYMENLQTERVAFQMHKVRRGETLAKIAKRYGSSIQPIVYVNNLKSTRYVKPGTTLAIPVKASKGREVALAHPEMS